MSSLVQIILVEDSQTQALQTQEILESNGYSVKIAMNGKIALELTKKIKPLLVITDVVMPEMDGYELCSRLKSNSTTKDIPIMLLTSLKLPEDVKNGLLCGADDYLPKPINEQLLLKHTSSLIENKDVFKDKRLDELSNHKVMNFLMSTYETALQKTQELEGAKKKLSYLNLELEQEVEERTIQLKQKVRELECLQEINGLYESVIDHSSLELLKETSHILMNSFTKPSLIGIYISMNNKAYETANFDSNYKYKLSSPIKFRNTIIGKIEVSYSDSKNTDPFTDNERKLIDSVAIRLFELNKLEENEKKILVQNEKLKDNLQSIERINAELEISRKKAVESDLLKSAFLANMSHEIRTPLNSIVGFSDILDDPDFDADTRSKYAEIIKDSSLNLLTIVNDILDISKIETGQMPIELEESDLSVELTSIYNVFTKLAKDKNVKLKLHNSPSEKHTIYTDVQKFKQIFTNLISNALKFTSKGSVEFGFLKYDKETTFFVKDTGSGITEEFQRKIFDRFTQAKTPAVKIQRGTGLGLAISKSMVELLGGEIWLESKINKGTTFYFRIPVVQAGT